MNVGIRTAIGLAVIGLLASGCGGSDEPEDTPTSQATAAKPPAAPSAKACYRLEFAAVLEPTNDNRPVSCGAKHTARTVYVGTIDPVVDGHLLAVDSARVQQQIARTCRRETDKHLGGSEETRRLSRLQPTWFSPSLDQSEAGALWFRCDVVLVAAPDRLGSLPTRTKGILGTGSARRLATCGTAAPGSDSFRRVTCASKHTWRARATIDLRGDRYLDQAVGREADADCKAIEGRLNGNSLTLRWSFEWPTRDQWRTGQRYGYCWTPERS